MATATLLFLSVILWSDAEAYSIEDAQEPACCSRFISAEYDYVARTKTTIAGEKVNIMEARGHVIVDWNHLTGLPMKALATFRTSVVAVGATQEVNTTLYLMNNGLYTVIMGECFVSNATDNVMHSNPFIVDRCHCGESFQNYNESRQNETEQLSWVQLSPKRDWRLVENPHFRVVEKVVDVGIPKHLWQLARAEKLPTKTSIHLKTQKYWHIPQKITQFSNSADSKLQMVTSIDISNWEESQTSLRYLQLPDACHSSQLRTLDVNS